MVVVKLCPLQIQIFDNGPGLPADIRDQVFDPFVSGRKMELD